MANPRTLGDHIQGIYETRSEADFEHMERMLQQHAGEPPTAGSELAELLLSLRAMERAEKGGGQ